MPLARFIDVLVTPHPNLSEGCEQRFKAADAAAPAPIAALSYDGRACAVSGWSSHRGGSPCPAFTVRVEDSGAGTAILLYGGDWGVRLAPTDGSPPLYEPYLLLSDDSVL